MFGFFIIRKLFDISCIPDHVQPILKPLSVVLAECGHFVVAWSEEYSCGHLVCAGIFLHSPVLLCGHIGLNKTKHRKRLGISTHFTFKCNSTFLKNAMNLNRTLNY